MNVILYGFYDCCSGKSEWCGCRTYYNIAMPRFCQEVPAAACQDRMFKNGVGACRGFHSLPAPIWSSNVLLFLLLVPEALEFVVVRHDGPFRLPKCMHRLTLAYSI
jgi:hypothetical protein